MNNDIGGYCYTNEEGWGLYRIPTDSEGNSVLTGEGSDDKGYDLK